MRFLLTTALLFSLAFTVMPVESAHARGHRTHWIDRKIDRKVEKKKTKRAIVGAGIGLIGGAILSDGDPWATIAGAAVGGIVGHATTKDPRDHYRRDRRYRR